jgi:hypothetical protein
MKSEEYIRVYRYFPPHPRSELLRVEFVFRRDVARAVAQQIQLTGIESVAKWAADKKHLGAGEWEDIHPFTGEIPYPRGTKATNASLIWLLKQVAPKFKELCLNGTIPDPEAFLHEYFL